MITWAQFGFTILIIFSLMFLIFGYHDILEGWNINYDIAAAKTESRQSHEERRESFSAQNNSESDYYYGPDGNSSGLLWENEEAVSLYREYDDRIILTKKEIEYLELIKKRKEL